MINEVRPDYVRIRTAAVKPGTELYDDWKSGVFELCSDDDKVKEIRRVIELSDEAPATVITSDHIINLLQDIEGKLSDKAELLAKIDGYLGMPEDERRAFQLLRRTLRAVRPADIYKLDRTELDDLRETVMRFDERQWDVKMNGYICNYV